MTESEPDVAREPATVPQPRGGVVRQILSWDDEEDGDRPLPDFPPLPEDPGWRIEHLPLVTAIGFALALFGFTAGFLTGGLTPALGLGSGIAVVAVGVTLSTLAIAWADVIRPHLVMPVGLGIYFVKYASILFLMFAVADSGWSGAVPMFWGIAIGAVLLTGLQAWWLTRLAARRAAAVPPRADQNLV